MLWMYDINGLIASTKGAQSLLVRNTSCDTFSYIWSFPSEEPNSHVLYEIKMKNEHLIEC